MSLAPPAELDYQLISLIALQSAALARFDQRQLLRLFDLARPAFGTDECRSWLPAPASMAARNCGQCPAGLITSGFTNQA